MQQAALSAAVSASFMLGGPRGPVKKEKAACTIERLLVIGWMILYVAGGDIRRENVIGR